MRGLLFRFVTNLVAVSVLAWVVPEIEMSGGLVTILITAGLFGVVNVAVHPLFHILASPIVLLTAVPFMLARYTLVLWLTSWLAGRLGVGFDLGRIVPLLLGAVIVSGIRMVSAWLRSNWHSEEGVRKEKAWIRELESATSWLEEQRETWRRGAEERRGQVAEQEAWIAELERATTWLREQRDVLRQARSGAYQRKP